MRRPDGLSLIVLAGGIQYEKFYTRIPEREKATVRV